MHGHSVVNQRFYRKIFFWSVTIDVSKFAKVNPKFLMSPLAHKLMNQDNLQAEYLITSSIQEYNRLESLVRAWPPSHSPPSLPFPLHKY